MEPNDTRRPEDTHQQSNNDLLEEGGHRPDRIHSSDERIRDIFSGVLAAADTADDRASATTSPRRRREALVEVVRNNNADPSEEIDDQDKENNGEEDIDNNNDDDDDDDDDPRTKATNAVDMAALQDRLRLDGPEGPRLVPALDDGSMLSMASFSASCKGCGKCVPSYLDGLVCSNALVARRSAGLVGGLAKRFDSTNSYPACGGIWCGPCYGLDESATGGGGGKSGTGASANDVGSSARRIAARNGDHLMTQFQCERCHFVNIQGRLPIDGFPKDVALLRNIQRATLDAFRARDDDEVADSCHSFREYVQCCAEMGVAVPLPPPAPVRDGQGMAAAAACVAIADADADDATQPHAMTGANKFERAASMLHALRSFEEAQCAGRGGTDQHPHCPATSGGPWLERFLDGLHLRLTGYRRPPTKPCAVSSTW